MPDEIIADTIVIVEDPMVGQFLRMLLQRQGYRVITAADAEEGTSLLLGSEGRVGLLITNTPVRFAAFGEQVPLLYLAAFPDPKLAQSFRYSRALSKPFAPEELVACARQLFGGADSPSIAADSPSMAADSPSMKE